MGIATDLIIIVLAGLLGGLVARRLNQPLIIGYILAGIAVGPFTGGITVSEIAEVEQLAEIGVALLLFSLGLEFSLKSLKPLRKIALGGTVLQIALTLLVCYGLGHLMEWQTLPTLWFATAMVSSSTAVILKTLSSRGQMGTLSSQVMLGMSIVQDIMVIPLMVILMNMNASGISLGSVLFPLGKVLLVVGAMLFGGAQILPRLMHHVAKWESRELFLLAVTGIGLGVGYLTYTLDLSFAFGAFLAGLVLSESDYGRAALNDLIPVRDLFGLLFFVSIGMLLDPLFLLSHFKVVGLLLGGVLLAKGLILGGTGRLFGYRNVIPLAMFLGMFPISEIAFIVLQHGVESGALNQGIYSTALSVVVLSMLVGPLATGLTTPTYRLIKKLRRAPGAATMTMASPDLANHVIVAGGGSLGARVGVVLQSLEHPYVIIEPHHATFLREQKEGLRLLYGDPEQDVMLQAAGVERARLLLVTLPGRMAILDLVKKVRKMAPKLPILARGEGPEECRLLEQHGVTRIINPELEAGLEMARQTLLQLNLPATLVLREIEALRRLSSWNPLEILPEHQALQDLRNASNLLQLEWLYIHPESPLEGKTLAESAIRREFGLSVVAVKRGEELFSDLHGAFQLLPEDYLAVVGTHEQNQHFLRTFSKRQE